MRKGIGFVGVDVTEEEYEHYQGLLEQFPGDYFENLFDTDDNGIITKIMPKKSIPWAILFFVQNLMINQHLRANDERIKKIEEKLGL